jgi:hypothetical protein
MTIWKFPLTMEKAQSLKVPLGAKFMHVAVQEETLCLWALVDETAPLEGRVIHVLGTGWDIPWNVENLEFLGSVLVEGGVFVWHVFWHKQGEAKHGQG